jgi:putative ABC transport system ATP-binding protein
MNTVMAKGLTKVFGEGPLAYTALRGVDFSASRGEFVFLEGPSGSGKTTLLSILGCVLSPTAGRVELLGQSVTALSADHLSDIRLRHVGFVFQGHNLIASLSALENVAYPAELAGLPRSQAKARAAQLLEAVGLGDRAPRKPSELSGGQRQRVAIARALVTEPQLLLADEPTASLDAESGRLVTQILKDLCRQRATTALVVTHDNRITHLADRRVQIEDGQIRTPGEN